MVISDSSTGLVHCADSRLYAVATPHLFNFVGDGLRLARQALISVGVPLPLWNIETQDKHPSLERPVPVRND